MKIIFVIVFIISASVSGLYAAPLDKQFTGSPMQARQHVLNTASRYENTPYLYGGMSPNGIDCSGLICLSFQEALGISLPRSASGLYTWAEKIPLEDAQPGDFLFFKTTNTNNITHVGLYLGNGRFIHAASTGSPTGVIYSNLSEQYWAKTYAGAGRALPESPEFHHELPVDSAVSTEQSLANARIQTLPDTRTNGQIEAQPDEPAEAREGRLLLGAAVAPTWNGFYKGGDMIRGFASYLRVGVDTYSLGFRTVIGIEARPEYDGALGVFRLPFTLSLGLNDRIRIFGGPVLSFGDASLSTDEGERSYSGGTSWFGTAGITAVPLLFETPAGEFAPYIELAWQSYFRDESDKNFNADFSAGFRFSTGLRWTYGLTGNK